MTRPTRRALWRHLTGYACRHLSRRQARAWWRYLVAHPSGRMP